MIQYPIFYRAYGVRRPAELLAPRLPSINAFALPRNSIYHYVGSGLDVYGPTMDDPFLRKVEKIVMVDHVLEMTEKKGNPRSTMIPATKLVNDYHRKNRKLRPLRKLESVVRDEKTVIVENYAILPHLYKYITNFFTSYNKWFNIQSTVWKKVEEMAQKTDRHQFIEMTLPRLLPSIAQLKRGEASMETYVDQFETLFKHDEVSMENVLDILPNGQSLKVSMEAFNRVILEIFNSPESLTFLDFWAWLGDKRSSSTMSVLSPSSLDKINLVWTESGRWFVINLGKLNSWRMSGKTDNVSDGDKITTGIKPAIMQRHMLRTVMSLFEVRTAGITDEMYDVVVDEDTDGDEEDDIDAGALDEEVIEAREFNTEEELTHDVDNVEKDSLEKDIAAAELDEDKIVEVDEELDEDIDQLDKMAEKINAQKEVNEGQPYVAKEKLPEEAVMEEADRMADAGLMSAAEYRRINKLSQRYKEIPNPFTKKGSFAELLEINEEDLKVPDENKLVEDLPGVLDKSMLSNSLATMDQKYIKSLYHKDIARAVMSVSKVGVTIQNYNVEKVDNHLNSYEIHTIKLVPVVGAPSTIRFRVPIIREDGTFIAGGIKQHLRRQRGDMPIRKLSEREVALTTYYGKLFVSKAERMTFNYEKWILNIITNKGLDEADASVTDIRFSDAFDHTLKVAPIYSILSKRFAGFKAGDITIETDWKRRAEIFTLQEIESVELDSDGDSSGLTLIGRKGKQPIVVDNNNIFYTVDRTGGLDEIGFIEDIVQANADKKPIEVLEVGIFGKPIPLGIVLAYEMGLSTLIRHLGLEPRRVPRGTNVKIDVNEFAVKFEDETLVFDRGNKMAEFIIGSFNRYHKDIRRYSVHMFDKKDVYLTVLERNGITARYVREMDMIYKLFVDDISRDILKEMKEPTDVVGLFLRAAELLTTHDYPDAADMRYMRDKGYERVSGIIYGELVRSLRAYKSRSALANSTVDMNPQAVWMTILQDPATAIIEDSNPIRNLKHKEVVIFGGVGGRVSRSMTEKHRAFDETHMGITSESTTDDSKVGTVVHLTADPNYSSIRGTVKALKDREPAKLVSPSMLLSPGADRDDPKRVNFIAIQHAQTVHAEGYTPTPLRTGYERVMALRTDDLFAYAAKEDGRVVELDEDKIVVEYKNGEQRTVFIGRRFGKAADAMIPHTVVTDLKVGQRFKKGHVITYNKEYFTRDKLDKTQVLWKAGVIAKTALLEGTDTIEDSSAISKDFAKKLRSNTTKVRDIRVNFDQEVRNLVEVGQQVDVESILCTIENPVGGGTDSIFDDKALETLKAISSLTPRAKFVGTVERIEVLYNGEKDDMSESLRKIAMKSDRELAKRATGSEKRDLGRVEYGFQLERRDIDMDSLIIRVYITGPTDMSVGDKAVFASQMKTVIGRVMTGKNQTESGEPIDAIFGYVSMADRIVISPILIGTTNTLLKLIGKKAVAAYRGK